MKNYLILMLLTIFPSILFAQSDFGVGANLNVNIPAGDFDEFYNTGYGGDAHFLYHLGNQAIFSFLVGYNMWKLNVDAFNNKVAEAGINYRFDLESDFKIIPVLVGIKWLLAQGKKSSLYVSFKGGVYNYTLSLKGTANLILPGGNSVPIEIPEVSESGTETMLALGLGYLFKLSKHWFVDFKGNYNILTNSFAVNKPVNPVDPNAVYGIKGTLQYVTILAGINYRF